jgi:Na+/melibiose symporter-like transporter
LASALGTGLSAIVQATALSPLGASWRWLYVLSVPFLLVVVLLSRSLPESTRYVAVAGRHDVSQGRSSLLARPPYRRPLLFICVMILFGNLATEATVFAVDYMESDRGLSSSAANLLLVVAGAVALPVLMLAGRLSDRIGRRYVCMAGLVVQAGGLLLFFTVARGVAGLGLALMTAYVGLFAAWTTGNAFAVELFPTALRGAASAASTIAKLLGQSASFALSAALLAATDSSSATVAVLVVGPVLAAGVIGVALPETSRRELTDLALAPAATAG